ncbi:LysR family transcriptional regulator [Demequina sp. NBRC 110057]|uniref:LysR family transcriptional regulator n=1 Tax=Demequina sp. NBRC 110057 TaxID=1570346 RepID=UPI000A073BEA|nr:LysR family transcriptional regulator [Demequina sp. NBRC 110057]
MELRHLRYFVAVVEHGSLTAAAAALHMSQPPLSVAIRKLEADLRVRLLDRSGRGVEPTDAGRALVERAHRLLAEVDDIAADLSRYEAGLAGTLTLAAVPTLLWGPIPELIAGHAAAAPEVDLHLVAPAPWTALDMLRERKADVAAIQVADAARFAARYADEFAVTPWRQIPLVAVLPPGMAEAPMPLPLGEFAGRTLVLPRRAPGVASLPEAVDAALERHGVVPGRVRTAETIQTSLPLIETGLAWGILPSPTPTALSRFAVATRPLDPAPTPLTALLVTRAGSQGDARIGRLLETAAPPDLTRSAI